jgi:hypothetical protein
MKTRTDLRLLPWHRLGSVQGRIPARSLGNHHDHFAQPPHRRNGPACRRRTASRPRSGPRRNSLLTRARWRPDLLRQRAKPDGASGTCYTVEPGGCRTGVADGDQPGSASARPAEVGRHFLLEATVGTSTPRIEEFHVR